MTKLRYSGFDAQVFQQKVDDSLKSVERILEVNRNPRLAEDVEHDYDDKYKLCDVMTNTALIAQLNSLVCFGVTAEVLQNIDKTKPATLRFQASDSCVFLKEQMVEEIPDQTTVETDIQTTSSFFSSTTRVVKNVHEYHWKIDMKWEISIYQGTDIEARKVLQTRSSSTVLVIQSNKAAPLPSHRECKPLDVSLTWLLKQIDTEAMTASFHIDTQHPETKTPRRNENVKQSLGFMRNLAGWTSGVRAYFDQCVQKDILDKHNPAGTKPLANQSEGLHSLSGDGIFVPVQPLMENIDASVVLSPPTEGPLSIVKLAVTEDNVDIEGDEKQAGPIFSVTDMHKLLDEQIRTAQVTIERLQQAYPPQQLSKLVSVAEATLVVVSKHSEDIGVQYSDCVTYVEKMLRDQLISAIGKQIHTNDIDSFVKYHNARLLNPAPQPFCHSIRRPDHYPDGLLSIESEDGDGKMEPIETLTRKVVSPEPIKLPLNAATTVQLTGDKFLHGWVQHRFGDARKSFKLIARARQFSSFILVVGTMAGSDSMDPKDAIILQNKDELFIPLILDELPTATEFKDAIKSLSPEQQRFAKAFRSMQLGSSVLGLCVIQIKPQLEALLGLPSDALTKEMKLTQELMELFVDYQVPSDLLSYDGIGEATGKDKVDNVKGHVKAVLDVIDNTKKEQLEEQKQIAEMAFQNAVAAEPAAFGTPGGSAPSPFGTNMLSQSHAFGSAPPMVGRSAAPARAMVAGGVPRSAEIKVKRAVMKKSPQPPPPAQAPQAPQQQQQLAGHSQPGVGSSAGAVLDFTMMPKILDSTIEQHAADSALRSTIVKTSNKWTRKRQENLLSKLKSTILSGQDIKSEKDKAFDLLDALSRSGSLEVACSELHVIVSVTHCFENDVMDTIIEDNINPIEKLEMSTLLVGSAIHGLGASRLVANDDDRARLSSSFPALLNE